MPHPVILTLDFGDLVMYEERFCDAKYIDEIFAKAAGRGVKTILWRTLGGARGMYRSRSVPTYADQSPKWPKVLTAYDPLEAAVDSAQRHGITIMAWATLQDFHIVRKHGRNTTPFYDARPHLYWSSPDDESFHMGVPCYAYEEARRYYMDHIEEVLAYGVDGVYVCFRSHSGEPVEDDDFGYNEPWRRQFREETSVDATPEQLRGNAWMAQRMQRIRGSSYTELLTELRQCVGGRPVWVGVAEEPDILLAGHSEKENPGRTLLRARLDVSGWCRKSLVDAVLVVSSRINPCDPSLAGLYRDTTARFGKKLYPWLNLVCHFPNPDGSVLKRTPTAEELRQIVARSRECEVDGVVLHETADLEFSYRRYWIDGQKASENHPYEDRDAQWDGLRG